MDPRTGKRASCSLSTLRTAAARRDWALRKSRELAALAAALHDGVPVAADITLSDAIAWWEEAEAPRLRPRTASTYRRSMLAFESWAQRTGVRDLSDIDVSRLSAFRDWLQRRPRRRSLRGGRRGETLDAGLRAASSVNVDLRAVRAVLEHWRRMRWLMLARDDLADGLRLLRESQKKPRPLTRDEVQQLVAACIAHDAATYKLTREEKGRGVDGGSAARHPEAWPFVRHVLLTGCRLGEARQARCCDVDLAAMTLFVAGTASKGAADRVVPLDVCPSLAAALRERLAHAGGEEFLYGLGGPLSQDAARRMKDRLVRDYGSPDFTWQRLRQTSASFNTNAPALYGGASAFHSAVRHGHDVKTAQKHYLGLVRVPADATTLEQAMGIDEALASCEENRPRAGEGAAGGSG